MRPAAWAVPVLLVLAAGCQSLNPAHRYQEAAGTLRFTLDRAEPSLEFRLPLERSRVAFHLRVGVENPSSTRFNLRSFQGDILLDQEGTVTPMGRVSSPQGLDLAPGGKGVLEAEVSFGYGDLRQHWTVLQEALAGRGAGAWLLQGTMRAQVLGVSFDVPIRTRRPFQERP